MKQDRVPTAIGVASRALEPQVSQPDISRHIDWYVKDRHLPPLITRFIDTRWRLYLLRIHRDHGEDSERFRESVKVMNNLAWSLRPKTNSISRLRLITLIPRLYNQLHVGLESTGCDEIQHDLFFADLAKLHQAALNPQTTLAEVGTVGDTKGVSFGKNSQNGAAIRA